MVFALCLGLVMQAQTTPIVSPVTSTEGYDFVTTFLPNGNSQRTAPDLKLQFLVSSRAVPGHPEITENVVCVQCGSYREDYRVPVNTDSLISIKADYAYWDIAQEKNQVETPLTLGVHIFSKNGVKMTVHAINQIGTDKSSFSMDGAQVLPKQALGHEYIVACNSEDIIATEFVIMSTKPGTKVNIQLPDNVTTSKGSKGALTATFPQPYQIYIVRAVPDEKNPTGSIDLSGTTICADQPVAVWAGNQAARFTTDLGNATADHAFDQLLSIDRWGQQFIVPMTGMQTRLNKLDIIARDGGTKVTLTTPKGTEVKTLGSAEKWSRLVDAYHGKEGDWTTLEDSAFVVTADKPIQVYLHTSSAVYNIDKNIQYHGDPSMTMISPLDLSTDTAVFATYQHSLKDVATMQYELVVWAKTSIINTSLKRNGTLIPSSLFKNLPGSTGYKYARIPISKAEEGYQLLTAAEKGFGGYVCGLENGQACLYPIGYDFMSVQDSLFLSKKYEAKEVHGGEFSTKYPDNGGGWYLDRVPLPNQPTQYDTIFICDSTKLRFPAIIHNDWNEIKWEVMRIDQSKQTRSAYEDKNDERAVSTDLANPYLETKFFVLPEKNRNPKQRHAYEDFEVRAILYREPVLCSNLDKEQWQKDTLSTIVRTYRSYNDTTWLIRCSNDNDIVDGTKIKFFYNPTTKEPELIDLAVGENGPFTRKYTTANGCGNDSVVTLYVLLCQSDVYPSQVKYLCEDELENIHSELDGFFETFDFLGTLQACKKNNNKGANGWTWYPNDLQWIYRGTDVIRTTDCNSKMQEWHDKYGAAYPRTTIGCDKSLTIELHVLPITTYEYEATTCKNSYEWTRIVNRDYNPKPEKEIIQKSALGEGSHDVIRYYTPGGRPPSGFDHMCKREEHVLHITFLTDHQTHIKQVELCQDDPTLVVTKTSDPDIADEAYQWTFNPREYAPGVYNGEIIECTNEDGCPYNLQYKITVHPVEIHRDTVVYCYEDGSRIEHKWEGHTKFWGNIKGKTAKTRYDDASKPLRIDRPKADPKKDSRIVYELSDTIFGSPCHTLYYQTVILLPPYSTSEKRTAISTEEWFEWHDVIWAGEKVLTDTIPNPDDKPISVLKEFGRVVPEGWVVDYLKGDYLYALTTTTTTRAYQRDDGSLTAACDSTVQLLVQVADEQVEYTYAYTCSNDTPYAWTAGDTTIYLNLREYQDPKQLPTTIHLEEHRKTVEKLWPVAGIGAHFYRDLTIYPSYLMPVDSAACQDPGKTVTFKGLTFSLDKPGVQEKGNHLYTEPKIWIHPETGEEVEVRCDSGEVVRMFVNPIYREDVNKELSTYQRSLYTHDTLTFFTEQKILFVGQDFFVTHPDIRDIEELKSKAGVDSAIVIDKTLVPELEVAKSVIYHSSQVSGGTKESCDSTTFLDITVMKTMVREPMTLGDNGEVLGGGDPWTFGGDTTVAREDGSRWHTCPTMTGDYFTFYYDKDGNVVEPVDYFDPSSSRGKDKDYHYNADGTRTYLLIDTVLLADGTFDVIVQNVVVYPTFMVLENEEAVEVCASDIYHWEGHYDIDVSQLDRKERQATAEDRLCAKQYADRLDYKGNPLCVDSICLLKLTIVGNGEIKQTRSRCFNDPAWAPEWKPDLQVCYEAGADPSITIRDVIPSSNPDAKCTDIYEITVNFKPAYGVVPCKGAGNQQYQKTYIEPYNYDTVVCRFDEDFTWLLRNGDAHIPSNLYLYDQDGNPDNRYTEHGNPTNKIPGNIVPTDLEFGYHIVRDSLLTVGCYCDSVLSLRYEIRDALEPRTIYETICNGEVYVFGDTTLTDPGTYERYIQEEGKPCKTKTTLYLTVEKASSFTIDPSPVCFGEANVETTYALRYSYKGRYPSSFSVHYDERLIEIGFKDIIDQKIYRSDADWKADSVYVLDLPAPQIDSREDYPTPGVYGATISFKNGLCFGEAQMTYPYEVKLNYPEWIMEQRHGDLIVLLDADYNGGYEWNTFQWYRNGQKMFGYTKPYLYVPEGLVYDSEESASYHVVLTKTSETGEVISSAPTCPITVRAMPNSPTNPDKDHGPSSDYISVTPTCVPRGGSIHLLALNENSSGEYRISTVEGQFVSKGEYRGKSTPVSIPSVEGMYIVQVWSSNKESKESYRAIKVIVRDTCPNCDKSSF